jgi:hypothetical protein
MKNVCHGVLESGSTVVEAERNDTIRKITPRGTECNFVLIGYVNLNLVVARETVHEEQNLMIGTIIDNLVNKGHWKVLFGIGVIEIATIYTNTDSALFFVDRDGVGDP